MGEYEARESEGELGLLDSRQRRRSCVQVGGELAEELEDAWGGGGRWHRVSSRRWLLNGER